MKKYILLFLFVITASVVKAQFPFYGFELNNYEVGDTLEYKGTFFYGGTMSSGGTHKYIYAITGKQVLSADSVQYKIKSISEVYVNYHLSSGVNEYTVTITNDTVYNNRNNILGLNLPAIDTSSGNWVTYDTTYGLKTLEAKCAYWSQGAVYNYVAKQNIGIIKLEKEQSGVPPFYLYNLIFFKLKNYGGYYGLYEPIFTSAQQVVRGSTPTIYNDNNGSAWIKNDVNKPLSLQIYDVTGRQATTLTLPAGENLLNINHLPAGMYLYKVLSGKEILAAGNLMNLK